MDEKEYIEKWRKYLIFPLNPSIQEIDIVVKGLMSIGKGMDPIVKLTLKSLNGLNEHSATSVLLHYYKILMGIVSFLSEMGELLQKDVVSAICKIGFWIMDTNPKVVRILSERISIDSFSLAPLSSLSGIVWVAACGVMNVTLL
jgi:hypothetical protein